MESPNAPSNQQPSPKMVVPVDLLISLTTVPLLVGLVGTKALTQVAQELGQLSEEVFRGDRLPLLKFPSQPSSIDTGDPH
ncbi:hypothetical protein [Leptodesmis sichuanensis]|uniref:hypothetical protein n=1 Tax=Leptodesmis sichuanensis TaxID=2906798 RepID=UPI001F3ED137|nr:hypothetical protein [Leptodesmis sichuanensis]